MALCLVVEDEPVQRRALETVLSRAGYQVLGCGTARDALGLAIRHRPELVLLDLGLPDIDGMDLLPTLVDLNPLTRVVVITGHDSVREAVSALRSGARHYLVKPWNHDELLLVVGRELAGLNRDEATLRGEERGFFWGLHPGMAAVRAALARLSEAPDTAVLIVGETGTGKELVARELHRVSGPKGPFVALNCAAVPAELMESELFGHERGAFSGAENRRRGIVELAHEGTLFLDEIGEMSPTLQAKLLRFLQDGTFRHLGSEVELVSRCRVVAATQAVEPGEDRSVPLRADLYYRLAVVRLDLPPLRERREDLVPLTHFLLEQVATRLGRQPRPMSARAQAALVAHGWPGNVRELAHRIERALVLGASDAIEPSDLDLATSVRGRRPRAAGEVLEDPARLRAVLETEGWNLARVARRLGVERHRVKYRTSRFGLRRPDTQ